MEGPIIHIHPGHNKLNRINLHHSGNNSVSIYTHTIRKLYEYKNNICKKTYMIKKKLCITPFYL